ncbi:MAG: heme ABC transporter ATP-binding protein [Gammaproteobacteria bacterium]|nr:heme ABC transporter ATP-binding protein [Gammaproteobacteria bacterium]
MNLLEVINVSVKVSARTLVDQISLTLRAGQLLSIIGPNGAGKSSLLKCVAGDIEPTEGKLQLHGFAEGQVQRARQLAVLPQLSLLNFPFRVSEVVALGRVPHSSGAAHDGEIIAHCLALMDITHLQERRYTTLSGGEKQRVQLARVIAQLWVTDGKVDYPRLLLLDEPTTALDMGHQQLLLTALQRLTEHGVAILMVLHDVNLAARCSDTILAMKDGHCVAAGPPSQVITAPTMQTLFNTATQIVRHPSDASPMVVSVDG